MTPVTGHKGVTKRDIDIEHLLIWTFRDQQAGRGGGWCRDDEVSSDGIAAAQRLHELGTYVDGGGSGGGLHPDASTVYEAVMRHGSRTVWDCACTGRRPDWMEGARHRFVPDYDDPVRKRGHLIYDHNRNVIGMRVIARDRPETIAAAREAYSAWHAELGDLARDLHDRLTDYRPWPPAAPSRPWDLPPRRVLPGQIWRVS